MCRIKKAQWLDEWHSRLFIEAEGPDGDAFEYVAAQEDPAPLNMELWDQAMQDPDAILDDEAALILSGEKPLPEGHTIIGGRIYNDAEQAGLMRGKAREALAELTTPEAIARAELDADYAACRREKMRKLLAIEEQEGFPYDVDWSGAL